MEGKLGDLGGAISADQGHRRLQALVRREWP
jgi:hypothetical protein